MTTFEAERWRRVGALFDTISLLVPAERAAALAMACADDPALREEVAALLRHDESTEDGGLLSAPSRVAALWADSAEQEEPLPERIGPWQVSRELGRGGMGVVYLAQRADGQFDQRAAIKLIRHGYDRQGLHRRFLRERQILARLEHPNIARLLDGGLDAQGQPYFAMEYVDGVPMFAHVAEYRCGMAERLRLFLKVCAAVQFAHRQLVVHRDIKPSNVLITRDGDVKLLDFGIATLVEEPLPDDETQTRRHAFTPAYAAPEQLRGEPVSTAADVHALGAMLHELLSGRLAYGLSRSSPLIERLHALDDPAGALPSRAVARQYAHTDALPSVSPLPLRALRGDLDLITATALHAEPERRYATVDAFADDVLRFLEGRPIMARADDMRYRCGRFVARHRASVAVALGLLLALVGALAWALLEADHARAQALQAQRQSDRAEAVRSFLVGVFEQSSPDAGTNQPITAHQLLEKGEEQLNADVAQEPGLQADAATLIAGLYEEIGDSARAATLLERALASSEDPRVPDDVKARVLVGIATGKDRQGAYDEALAQARRAVQILQRDAHGSAQTLAQAHEVIAHGLIGKGELGEAEHALRSALSKDGAALGRHDEALGEDWVQLGNALAGKGDFAAAENAFNSGIDVWRAAYGDDSNHVGAALSDLSNALHDKGDLVGAEKALRQALEICMRTVGAAHHDTFVVQNNLFGILEAQGRFDEAVAGRLRIAALEEASGQMQPIDRVAEHLTLGVDYRELGLFDKATGELEQTIALLDTLLGPLSPRHVSAMRTLGSVQMLSGHYRDAEATLRKALAIQLEADPSATIRIALGRFDLGNVLHKQHRHAEAIEQLRQAADAFVEKAQKAAPGRSGALAALSEAQLDKGDLIGARGNAEASLAYARQDLPAANYHLGDSLYALARVDLASGLAEPAEALAREAASVRSPPYPANDLRTIEVQVALETALAMQKRSKESLALQKEIEERLQHSSSPYRDDLLARLGNPDDRATDSTAIAPAGGTSSPH